ncbi:MAG TPA: heme NO-binding domain-containing protein, partial [Burkholderiales bacterium]|nr:heme NO-binding domain-containing protein [Burkholderiales bacterium]
REVRKLYADAELPRFAVLERKPNSMVLLYESPRHFADLAEGLIGACARHYGETLSIARENLASKAGSRVRFVLERR